MTSATDNEAFDQPFPNGFVLEQILFLKQKKHGMGGYLDDIYNLLGFLSYSSVLYPNPIIAVAKKKQLKRLKIKLINICTKADSNYIV